MKIIWKYYKTITAVFSFIVYLLTLAPTVIHLDAGELAAVQSTLGIAHPTGYPLFTILGYLLSSFFFFLDDITVLNLLAAIYCSIAVYFIAAITHTILENLEFNNPRKSKTNLEIKLTSTQKIVISVAVTLSVAFSETFWFQSTSVEVYSLHLALITSLIFILLKAYFSLDQKYWFIAAALLALGFTNHMTTILILPAFAYFFFRGNGFNEKSFKLIGKMLLVFFPLLIIFYAYLPLRASADPILNWGNPVDWERILRHVSGKQYQVWIFSSIEAAKKQFVYFIESLPAELGYIGIITSIAGFFFLLKYQKSIAIFFLISFITTILYSVNYDIADIDAYFLLAYISFLLFSIGIFVKIAATNKHSLTYLFFLIPAIILAANFSKVDQSNVYTFEDYTKSLLDNSSKNAVIFSYQWDYFISPSYYFQYVENYRNDVVIIDKELLRRSWYFDQLRNNMPEVVDGAKNEIDAFLKAVQPFERDEPFNSQFIEKNFREMMTALISENLDERDFYITLEVYENEMRRGEVVLPEGYTLVPMGLFFKVVKFDSGYIASDDIHFKIRYSNIENYYQKQVRRFVAASLTLRLMYELQFDKIEKAEVILDKLKTDYPEFQLPAEIAQRLNPN